MKNSIDKSTLITSLIVDRFRCFGGGKNSCSGNPISAALKDEPACFAAGVDVKEVVEFVIKMNEKYPQIKKHLNGLDKELTV